MRIAEYALPVAALVALAACSEETGEKNDVDSVATEPNSQDVVADEVVDAEPVQTTLEIIPTRFQGLWDLAEGGGDYTCTTVSDGVMAIEEEAIEFYEARFEPSSIKQISADEITSDGEFFEPGESSKESYRLKLSKDGKRLSLSGNGFEPFEYRYCGKQLKPVTEAFVPQAFHGKWAFSQVENCKITPFRDLIVKDRKVTIGGIEGTVQTMDIVGTDAIKVGYKTTDGRDATMRLQLTPDRKKIGLLEPGATGVTFVKCP